MDDFPSAAPTLSLSDTLAHDHVATVAPGSLIGRYVVVDHAGAGGMGSVYVAYDAELARRVAIKVLRPDARGGDGRARLVREAQAMARLAHPNVLTVYDVGVYGDDVFIAMELVEGQTLKAWMREGHSWRDVVRILSAAGQGLAAAHAAGLVHRDFKPENVLLGSDGRVVVADFGIARAQDVGSPAAAESGPSLPPPSARAAGAPVPAASGPLSSSSPSFRSVPAESSPSSPTALETPLTEAGAMLGTVGYMAPERAFDARDDARSDQFSFGVTLYRALYGKPPFVYTSLSTYLAALLTPPEPPLAGTRVPAWVHAVVTRALQREPEKRFASMSDLLAALGRDPTRRRRGLALGAIALAALGATAFGVVRHRALEREACSAGDRLIAETWSPARRDAVGEAIRASHAPLASDFADRAQHVLDAWSAGWAAAYRDAAEATLLKRSDSSATMNVRLACLEREREEMDALVARLSHADKAVANRALTASYQLSQPRVCWEPNAARAAALPEAPEPRARVLALQRHAAEAWALRMTGGCEGVFPAAEKGIEEARAIPYREAEAEFLMLRSACERQRGDSDAATATRQGAFAAAIAAGDDSLAVVAAAKIAFELGDNLARPHEAERWLAIGQGVLDREGHDERAEAELVQAEAQILSGQGYTDRTLGLHERAIAMLTKVYGPLHPAVAAATNNLATDLSSVGRQEEAIAALRRSAGIDETLFGPDNPMLHIDYNNIGVGYTLLGRYDEARTALERSLVLVRPLGEKSANAIVPWASMAVLENRAGHPDAALADLDRAMGIVDATGDNGARYLPCLYEERGTALLAKGDPNGAIDACGRALKLQEAEEFIGPDKVYTDDALTCLGSAELAVGKTAEALVHLERGATLTKRESKDALARAELALAKALRVAGRDPQRARTLAQTALAELRGKPGADADVKAAEEWLAASGGE